MGRSEQEFITVGKITAVYGIKGWLKVHSYTDPIENILNYRQWRLIQGRGQGENPGQQVTIDIDNGRRHNNGIVVHIAGVDDREKAGAYTQMEICVASKDMPQLEDGEYYWHQLEGLSVFACCDKSDGQSAGSDGQSAGNSDEQKTPDEPGKLLGKVAYLMETGANDVIVVQPEDDKADELLIPFLPERVVKRIDLAEKLIVVDWVTPV